MSNLSDGLRQRSANCIDVIDEWDWPHTERGFGPLRTCLCLKIKKNVAILPNDSKTQMVTLYYIHSETHSSRDSWALNPKLANCCHSDRYDSITYSRHSGCHNNYLFVLLGNRSIITTLSPNNSDESHKRWYCFIKMYISYQRKGNNCERTMTGYDHVSTEFLKPWWNPRIFPYLSIQKLLYKMC